MSISLAEGLVAVRERNLSTPYRKTMQRFSKQQDFGIGVIEPGDTKAKPIHMNSRNKPRPWLHTSAATGKAVIGIPAHITPAMELRHLRGQPDGALFHVGRSDRNLALLALDIDCEMPGDWRVAADYGLAVIRQIFPKIVPFAEPGRSFPRKAGAYLWVVVDWKGTPPKDRRMLETLLNRRLRAVAAATPSPAGVKFDGLKGTVTYREPNPKFDEAYAEEEGWSGQYEYEVEPGHWLPAHQAKKFYSAAGVPHEQIGDFLGNARQQYRMLSRMKCYERDKLFYKLNGAQFQYNDRLERERRHFGILVTRPCYGAFGDGRPNNVQAFIDWTRSKAGRVSVSQLLRGLPRQTVEQYKSRSSGTKPKHEEVTASHVEPRVAKQPADLASDIPATRARGRSAKAIAADPLEDPNSRMYARVGMELRQLGRADPMAQCVAADRAVHWYEGPDGPATGHSPEEHDARIERARVIATKLAVTFDALKASGKNPGLWVDQERIALAVEGMRPFIPDELIAVVTGDPRVTRRAIAAVYLAMLHNINSGNTGEVPVKSIRKLLVAIGVAQTNSTIASAKQILQSAGLLSRVRAHFHEKGSRGRCEVWAVRTDKFVPQWAWGHLRPEACLPRPDALAFPATPDGVAA